MKNGRYQNVWVKHMVRHLRRLDDRLDGNRCVDDELWLASMEPSDYQLALHDIVMIRECLEAVELDVFDILAATLPLRSVKLPQQDRSDGFESGSVDLGDIIDEEGGRKT